VALHLDPSSEPDPEREDELRASGARVELRPATRVAHLAERSLACPSCAAPVAIAAPVGWDEQLACSFCESEAPTRDYLQDRGWPRVALIARLG
jgi:hypothetical protein